MRPLIPTLAIVGTLAAVGAQLPSATGQPGEGAAPLFGVTIPPGYRAWRLIAVAREEGSLDDIRAVLGNDIAAAAAREERLPYPDGTVFARLAWSYHPLEESAEAFGRHQSFVSGHPRNGVQFMVKDSRRYAATDGWGYGHFDDGGPAGEAVHATCHACHQVVRSRDFVFNRYAR